MEEGINVITLCGSTKFKEEFLRIEQELTWKGNVVISVGGFAHADGIWDKMTKEKKAEKEKLLAKIHRKKIDMADEIFVINKNGYIGNSTKTEILYAKEKNKQINYLEESKE